MQNPKIKTTLTQQGGLEPFSGEAYLLVVPDRGERITIGDKEFTVSERRFTLVKQYNGGKFFGYSEECTLILKAYKTPTLDL